MKISIIIPTLNEDKVIFALISYLIGCLNGVNSEIIVVDANSQDKTQQLSLEAGAKVISVSKMSRAFQMNEGAKIAQGEILYFVHADSFFP